MTPTRPGGARPTPARACSTRSRTPSGASATASSPTRSATAGAWPSTCATSRQRRSPARRRTLSASRERLEIGRRSGLSVAPSRATVGSVSASLAGQGAESHEKHRGGHRGRRQSTRGPDLLRAAGGSASMTADLPRRLLAEAVGTGLLVLFGAGSVLAALTLGNGKLDFPGLGMIALAFGLVIAVAIYAFGTTSGAHINPAVSVSLAATGRFPWADVPAYIAAQLVGAFGGALLLLATFSGPPDMGTGQNALAAGVSFGRGVVTEAAGTFLLVTAIMALAVDRRAPGGWAGLMIGLSVTCAIIVFGPVTGAS